MGQQEEHFLVSIVPGQAPNVGQGRKESGGGMAGGICRGVWAQRLLAKGNKERSPLQYSALALLCLHEAPLPLPFGFYSPFNRAGTHEQTGGKGGNGSTPAVPCHGSESNIDRHNKLCRTSWVEGHKKKNGPPTPASTASPHSSTHATFESCCTRAPGAVEFLNCACIGCCSCGGLAGRESWRPRPGGGRRPRGHEARRGVEAAPAAGRGRERRRARGWAGAGEPAPAAGRGRENARPRPGGGGRGRAPAAGRGRESPRSWLCCRTGEEAALALAEAAAEGWRGPGWGSGAWGAPAGAALLQWPYEGGPFRGRPGGQGRFGSCRGGCAAALAQWSQAAAAAAEGGQGG